MISALICVATALYFEARSEPPIGQVAVAHVIENRVVDPSFPDDPCSVVYQGRELRPGVMRINGCQFSFYCDGRPEVVEDRAAFGRAFILAAAVRLGLTRDITDGATDYHDVSVNPGWPYRRTITVYNHRFYSRKKLIQPLAE